MGLPLQHKHFLHLPACNDLLTEFDCPAKCGAIRIFFAFEGVHLDLCQHGKELAVLVSHEKLLVLLNGQIYPNAY